MGGGKRRKGEEWREGERKEKGKGRGREGEGKGKEWEGKEAKERMIGKRETLSLQTLLLLKNNFW